MGSEGYVREGLRDAKERYSKVLGDARGSSECSGMLGDAQSTRGCSEMLGNARRCSRVARDSRARKTHLHDMTTREEPWLF